MVYHRLYLLNKKRFLNLQDLPSEQSQNSTTLPSLFAKIATAFSKETGEEMVKYSDEELSKLIQEKYHQKNCHSKFQN